MSKKKMLAFSVVLIISVVFAIWAFCSIENIAFSFLISLFELMFSLLLCNYKENIAMIAFMVCFFVFLMGRPFANEIIGYSSYSVIPMDLEMRTFVYVCLSISLISIMSGYTLCRLIKKKKWSLRNDGDIISHSRILETEAFRKVTKYVTILFYLLAIIENVFRLIFVKDVGYTASYAMEHNYDLPFGVHYLVIMAPVVLSLFLATLPKRRELAFPVIMFVVSNLLIVASGNRFEIVSCFLIIIIYFIWRNDTDGIKWISKKQLVCIIALVPIFVAVMQYMIYWREGRDVKLDSDPIVGFLHSTGGSSSIIGATKYHENTGILDNGVLYSVGGVWRGLNGNIIAKALELSSDYGKGQTAEYARGAHSLGSALTFHYAPEKYLAGYGLGGCYIAELYHDFSMIGVVIGNALIGAVLGLIRRLEKKRVLRNFFCIYLLMLFLRLPRDSFDYPITNLLNLKTILLFVILVVITKCVNSKALNLKDKKRGQIDEYCQKDKTVYD